MKSRPLAAFSVVASLSFSPFVAACSPLDVFGPRPNGELLTLARQAEADAASLSAPFADVRSLQATELYDEIARLCGTDSSGLPPSSCAVERGAGDVIGAPDAVDATRAQTSAVVDGAGKLPEDSVALVVSQAIDTQATLDAETVEDETEFNVPDQAISAETDPKAHAAASRLIDQEYAVQFGLDVASAYADDALRTRIDELRVRHDARIDALRRAFVGLPARAPGYKIDGGGPANTADATSFVDAEEAALVDSWRSCATTAVAESKDPAWGDLAIQLAGHVQAASAQ